MIKIIVMTHGDFGAYLVEAAEGIVGRQEEGVVSIGISPRVSIDEVGLRLQNVLMNAVGGDGVVVAVDMPGGTPCNVAVPVVSGLTQARIISGVNLYMLVTAFSHRGDLSLDELVEKMISSGKRSIADIQAMLRVGR